MVAVADEDRDRTARSASSAADMAIILTSAALPTITSLVAACRAVAVEDAARLISLTRKMAIRKRRKRRKRRRRIRRWEDA
jgi:hypothetical protein